MPEIYTMLYINYISIKLEKKEKNKELELKKKFPALT